MQITPRSYKKLRQQEDNADKRCRTRTTRNEMEQKNKLETYGLELQETGTTGMNTLSVKSNRTNARIKSELKIAENKLNVLYN